MNESTTLLKVGTADLVLQNDRERRARSRDLTLENPIRAIREISHDLTGTRAGAAGGSGRTASASGDPARVPTPAPSTSWHANGSRHRSIGPCHRALGPNAGCRSRSRISQPDRPGDRLGDEVPTDRALPRQARSAVVLPAGRSARSGLSRHLPSSGGSTTCSRSSGCGRPGSPRTCEIFEAKSVPPQTTRAKLRGDFIKKAQEKTA